jgi:hypothetical protein
MAKGEEYKYSQSQMDLQSRKVEALEQRVAHQCAEIQSIHEIYKNVIITLIEAIREAQ